MSIQNANIPRSPMLDAAGRPNREWLLYFLSFAGSNYQPTILPVVNVNTLSISPLNFARTQSTVTVSGQLTMVPTVAGVLTQIDIPLPVQSNFSNGYQVSGTSVVEGAGTAGYITGNVSTHNALLSFTPASGATQVIDFTFTYQIV